MNALDRSSQVGAAAGELMYFGVGAQKAATSWLGDYLNKHPQVGGNPLKAYHYFNRAFPTGAAENLDYRPKVHPLLVPIFANYATRKRVSNHLHGPDRWLTRYVPRSYKSLVRGPQPTCRAFGDVTPAYCLLTAAAFGAMRRLHPRTRFFFVMRDPVDRLWSAVRMNIRKGYHLSDLDDDDLLEWVKSFPTDYDNYERSNYKRTIQELEKSVPPEDILYLFYEELFTEASIRRLTRFLGLDYVEFSNERVHGGDGGKMSSAWKRRAREALDPIYVFVDQKFGAEVPAYWNDETRYV